MNYFVGQDSENFLVNDDLNKKSIISSIKEKIKSIHIIVFVIFVLVLYYIKNHNINTYPLLKILNNNIVSIILILVAIFVIFKYWDKHKKTIIIFLIISIIFVYMIRDNVNSTEAFKEIINDNIQNNNNNNIVYNTYENPESRDNIPYLDNLTQKLNYELPPMDHCSPDITNIIDIQNGDFNKLIGCDLEGNGNDFDLRNQKQIFGKIVSESNINDMGDIQGLESSKCIQYSNPDNICYNTNSKNITGIRDFLDTSDKKTVINKRKSNNTSIFDARDLSIQTNNGVKKMAEVSTNQICTGINCPKPEFMDM